MADSHKPTLPASFAVNPQEAWHITSPEEVARRWQTNLNSGLSAAEVQRRLAVAGPNRLREEKRESFWAEFVEELREPMILLLLVTGVIYALWGELGDALTIFFVILALNTLEVVNEQRAKKAISALRKFAEPNALVLRDGYAQEAPQEQLVPGDIILLQAGRRVPADARLTESYGLAVDESTLTGESMPVEKEANLLLNETIPLAERSNLVFSGSLVTRGRGRGIVVKTGMATELGRVAGLAWQVKEPRTPLQQAMNEVSKSLVWIALGFSILVPVLGVLIAGQPLKTMLLTGLSLAFATIPEEMPIIITMVLALGAYRLSKEQAIVKHLKAVETLGAVTVIATDKTGTLTQNRLEVSQIYPAALRRTILEAAVLAGATPLNSKLSQSDPLETALIRAAEDEGLELSQLDRLSPRVNEFTFDNTRKRMAVIRRDGPASRVWLKGAPESVLPLARDQCTAATVKVLDPTGRQEILQAAARMAAEGLRVIALAEKSAVSLEIRKLITFKS